MKNREAVDTRGVATVLKYSSRPHRTIRLKRGEPKPPETGDLQEPTATADATRVRGADDLAARRFQHPERKTDRPIAHDDAAVIIDHEDRTIGLRPIGEDVRDLVCSG